MSSLENKISELERELALKKGYQAVKFSLPKNLPDDVSEEIQNKLREIADSLALKQDALKGDDVATTFTLQQVETLKMIADMTVARASSPAQPTVTLNGGVTTQSIAPHVNPQIHVPKPSTVPPKKGKIITAENVRGEGKKYAAPDDEIYIANPDKVDAHGMVSATHMKRGVMIKIPVDDVEFTT